MSLVLQQGTICNAHVASDAYTIAVHRKTATLLVCSSECFYCKRRKPGIADGIDCPWIEHGRWNFPKGMLPMIGAVSLEAFDAFFILTSDAERTVIFILSASFLTTINVHHVPKVTNVVSFDYDQNRREVVCGLLGGVFVSLTLRPPKDVAIALKPYQRKSKRLDELSTSYQCIPRLQSRFPPGYIGTPLQIVTQDAVGTFLCLSDSGNVMCVSAELAIIWYINQKHFLSKPVKLFGDKFGSSFVLHFHHVTMAGGGLGGSPVNDSRSSSPVKSPNGKVSPQKPPSAHRVGSKPSTPGSGRKRVSPKKANSPLPAAPMQAVHQTDTLEYWVPPATYALCQIHLFSRATILLDCPLVGLLLETVGGATAASFTPEDALEEEVSIISSSNPSGHHDVDPPPPPIITFVQQSGNIQLWTPDMPSAAKCIVKNMNMQCELKLFGSFPTLRNFANPVAALSAYSSGANDTKPATPRTNAFNFGVLAVLGFHTNSVSLDKRRRKSGTEDEEFEDRTIEFLCTSANDCCSFYLHTRKAEESHARTMANFVQMKNPHSTSSGDYSDLPLPVNAARAIGNDDDGLLEFFKAQTPSMTQIKRQARLLAGINPKKAQYARPVATKRQPPMQRAAQSNVSPQSRQFNETGELQDWGSLLDNMDKKLVPSNPNPPNGMSTDKPNVVVLGSMDTGLSTDLLGQSYERTIHNKEFEQSSPMLLSSVQAPPDLNPNPPDDEDTSTASPILKEEELGFYEAVENHDVDSTDSFSNVMRVKVKRPSSKTDSEGPLKRAFLRRSVVDENKALQPSAHVLLHGTMPNKLPMPKVIVNDKSETQRDRKFSKGRTNELLGDMVSMTSDVSRGSAGSKYVLPQQLFQVVGSSDMKMANKSLMGFPTNHSSSRLSTAPSSPGVSVLALPSSSSPESIASTTTGFTITVPSSPIKDVEVPRESSPTLTLNSTSPLNPLSPHKNESENVCLNIPGMPLPLPVATDYGGGVVLPFDDCISSRSLHTVDGIFNKKRPLVSGSYDMVHFIPLSYISMVKLNVDQTVVATKPVDTSGIFCVTSGPAMLVETTPSRDKLVNSNSVIKLLGRQGLKTLTNKNFQDLSNVSESAFLLNDISHCGIACRAHSCVIFNTAKEGLSYDICSHEEFAQKSSNSPDVLTIPFDIKTGAVRITCLHVADVSMLLPPSKIQKPVRTNKSFKMLDPSASITGSMILTFVGDSSGQLHYCLSTTSVCSSSMRVARNQTLVSHGVVANAHSEPIVSVMSTGDSTRPMWQIGIDEVQKMTMESVVSTKPKKAESHSYFPTCAAGSVVVSMTGFGEVKLWQPTFVKGKNLDNNSYAKTEDILYCYDIEWVTCGFFSLFTNEIPASVSCTYDAPCLVTSVTLDPTCMTLIIATSYGIIFQWAIPGLSPFALLPSVKGAVTPPVISTCRNLLWRSVSPKQTPSGREHYGDKTPWITYHADGISDVRLCVHNTLPANYFPTTINELPLSILDSENMMVSHRIDVNGASSVDQEFGQVRSTESAGPVIAPKFVTAMEGKYLKEKQPSYGRKRPSSFVAYTIDHLRYFVSNSTMVSSSADKSVMIWKFSIATYEQTEPGSDRTNSWVSGVKYLQPVACRRIVFSDTPRSGICIPSVAPGAERAVSESWKVMVLVSGKVITALEASSHVLITQMETSDVSISTGVRKPSRGSDSNALALLEPNRVAMDRVVCNVLKPKLAIKHAFYHAKKTEMLPKNTRLRMDYSFNILEHWTSVHQTIADAHSENMLDYRFDESLDKSEKQTISDTLNSNSTASTLRTGADVYKVVATGSGFQEDFEPPTHCVSPSKPTKTKEVSKATLDNKVHVLSLSNQDKLTKTGIPLDIPSNVRKESFNKTFDKQYAANIFKEQEELLAQEQVVVNGIHMSIPLADVEDKLLFGSPSSPHSRGMAFSPVNDHIPESLSPADRGSPTGKDRAGSNGRPKYSLMHVVAKVSTQAYYDEKNAKEKEISLSSPSSPLHAPHVATHAPLSSPPPGLLRGHSPLKLSPPTASLDPELDDHTSPRNSLAGDSDASIGGFKEPRAVTLRRQHQQKTKQRLDNKESHHLSKRKPTMYISKSVGTLNGVKPKSRMRQGYANNTEQSFPTGFYEMQFKMAKKKVVVGEHNPYNDLPDEVYEDALDTSLSSLPPPEVFAQPFIQPLLPSLDDNSSLGSLDSSLTSSEVPHPTKVKADRKTLKCAVLGIVPPSILRKIRHINKNGIPEELLVGDGDGSVSPEQAGVCKTETSTDGVHYINPKNTIVRHQPKSYLGLLREKINLNKNNLIHLQLEEEEKERIRKSRSVIDGAMRRFAMTDDEVALMQLISPEETVQARNSFEGKMSADEMHEFEALSGEAQEEKYRQFLQERASNSPTKLAVKSKWNLLKGKSFDKGQLDGPVVIIEEEKEPEPDLATVEIEPGDVTHNAITISVLSNRIGRLLIGIMKADAVFPSFSDIYGKIAEEGDIVLDEVIQLLEETVINIEEPIKVSFRHKVDAATAYQLFAVVVPPKSSMASTVPPFKMTDATYEMTKTFVTTNPERLEIEWERLNSFMQDSELLASILDYRVRKSAESERITIPSEKVILNRANMKSNAKLDARVVAAYVNWWVGGDTSEGFSVHRSMFLAREAIFGLRDVDVTCYEEEAEETGDSFESHHQRHDKAGASAASSRPVSSSSRRPSVSGATGLVLPEHHHEVVDAKSELHRLLVTFGLVDRDLERMTEVSALDRCAEDGFITPEEVDELHAMGENMDPTKPFSLTEHRMMDEMPSFRKYRSWFKGGNIVKHRQEQIEQDVHEEMARTVAMEGMESPLHALNISDSTMGMGDQDVVHDHAVANHSLMESRLLYRTGSLRVRCYQVNRCIEKTQTLISLYKKCTKLGLSNHDMETRRSELKPEDLLCIMGTQKLVELLTTNGEDAAKAPNGRPWAVDGDPSNTQAMFTPIDVSLLTTFTPVDVAHLHIFSLRNIKEFIPNNPPDVLPMFYPSTDLRPVRPWYRCSDIEKFLELKLACMLDTITELAFHEGVYCPDAEDFLPLSSFVAPASSIVLSTRSTAMGRFISWYTGDESVNENREHSEPSWARVVFANEFEIKMVEQDPFVLDYMIKNCCYEFPEEEEEEEHHQLEPIAEEVSAEALDEEGKLVDGEASVKASGNPSAEGSPRAMSDEGEGGDSMETDGSMVLPQINFATAAVDVNSLSQFDTPREDESSEDDEEIPCEIIAPIHPKRSTSHLLYAYEEALSSASGKELRIQLMKRHLISIMVARQSSMARYMYPPGPTKSFSEFMMPRLSIVMPVFEMPPKRYKLFPSRSSEAYDVTTILSWYRDEELMDEDDRMVAASIKGRKMAKYNDWLANTQQRVEEGRLMMLEEDAISQQIRSYWEPLEDKLSHHVEGDANTQEFIVFAPLPPSYDFIDTDTLHYPEGSGAKNEDELMDIVAEMNRKKEEEMQLVLEAKRKLAEERRIAEEQRRLKVERAERDARLAEGVEIRRKLRVHLADIKANRILEKEKSDQRVMDEAEAERKYKMFLEEEAVREMAAECDKRRMHSEQMAMAEEEIAGVELLSQMREMDSMAWEDERSRILAHKLEKEKVERGIAIEVLDSVYQPFEPFKFSQKRYPGPTIYGNAGNADEYDYSDAIVEENNRQVAMLDDPKEGVQCTVSDIAAEVIAAEQAKNTKGVWPRQNSAMDITLPNMLDDTNPYRTATTLHSRARTPLRKQVRPYTNMNIGEADLLEKDVEFADYTVMQDNAHVMQSLGLSKNLANVTLNPPSRLASPIVSTRRLHRLSRVGTTSSDIVGDAEDSISTALSIPPPVTNRVSNKTTLKPLLRNPSLTDSLAVDELLNVQTMPVTPAADALLDHNGRHQLTSSHKMKKKTLLPITATNPMAVLLNKHNYDEETTVPSTASHRLYDTKSSKRDKNRIQDESVSDIFGPSKIVHQPSLTFANSASVSGIAPEERGNLQHELLMLDSLTAMKGVENTVGLVRMMDNQSNPKNSLKSIPPPQKYEPRSEKIIQQKKTETLMLLRHHSTHRNIMNKYVSTRSVLGDRFDFMGCSPEEQTDTILERDPFVQSFVRTLPAEYGHKAPSTAPTDEASKGAAIAEFPDPPRVKRRTLGELPAGQADKDLNTNTVSNNKPPKERIRKNSVGHPSGPSAGSLMGPPFAASKPKVSMGILGQSKKVGVNVAVDTINAAKSGDRNLRRSLLLSRGRNANTNMLTEASVAASLSTPRPKAFELDYNDSHMSSRRSSITSVDSYRQSVLTTATNPSSPKTVLDKMMDDTLTVASEASGVSELHGTVGDTMASDLDFDDLATQVTHSTKQL